MECGKARERERDGPAEYFPNNFFHQRNSCFLTLQACVNSTTLFSLENFGSIKKPFQFLHYNIKKKKSDNYSVSWYIIYIKYLPAAERSSPLTVIITCLSQKSHIKGHPFSKLVAFCITWYLIILLLRTLWESSSCWSILHNLHEETLHSFHIQSILCLAVAIWD